MSPLIVLQNHNPKRAALMPIMVGMEMRMMGVMDFKAHGKIVTRFIRDSSLACQTDSGIGSVLRLTLRICVFA